MDYGNYASQHAQPYQFFVPSKPGPPYSSQDDPAYNPLDAFSHPSNYPSFFDQHAQYPPSAIIPPAPAQSPPLLHQQQQSHHQHALQGATAPHALPPDTSSSLANELNLDMDFEQAQGRSSDDEKESLTPAQSRRKAQNRAAQRAFRERKERHVKDLELKLKSMEARSTEIMSDNERLKRELDRVATQNEILRATSGSTNNPSHNNNNRGSSSSSPRSRHHQQAMSPGGVGEDPDGNLAATSLDDPSSVMTIPHTAMVYSPRTFNAAFSADQAPTVSSTTIEGPAILPSDGVGPMTHRVAINDATGERLLSTGAAWEYIQHSEPFQRGAVDLGEVVDRLRERVICDGAGPSFPESEVRKAIEESVGGVGDELI